MKRRPKLQMTLNECSGCPGECCQNLSIWIGAPKTKSEIEDLMWEVRFDTVQIYIRSRKWYLLVKGRCMYLNKDYFCDIYSTRPEKCRDHNPPNCEKFGQFWDVMINNPEELAAFLKKRKQAAKRRKKAREKKSAGRL